MDVDLLAHSAGLSWTVTDEALQRGSHALAADGRVWLVDPVDHAPAIEEATALGEPAAVIQLLDRHPRGCEAVAERLGIPHLRLPDAVPDAPFEIVRVLDVPGWRERALWWPATQTLVVAEAVGSPNYFTAGKGAVGVHPFLRPFPPRGVLRGFDPETLLMGHGPPLLADATAALHRGLDRARTDLPRAWLRMPFTFR